MSGQCPRCGATLIRREPDHGTAYWTCSDGHDPPVVLMCSRQFDYAAALVRCRFTDACGTAGVSPFTAAPDGADPAAFVDVLSERLSTVRRSHQATERTFQDRPEAQRTLSTF
jgi:hypothetical protein